MLYGEIRSIRQMQGYIWDFICVCVCVCVCVCNKVLLKYKGDRESFWHRHQKGAKEYRFASISNRVIYSPKNPKNVWRLQRPHQTHSHNLHFKITELARRFNPKIVLRQDTFL